MTDWKTNVAPIHINFMLACYCGPDPEQTLGSDHWNSEAGMDTRIWLAEKGLIGDDLRATEKGEAWVKFICETPLPVSKWGLPERGGEA